MQPSNYEAIDHDLRTGPAAIPVTVLTGFLGAGKTTLMNRILNGDHGLRVAVLVNDFGSLNIDAELIVGVESDVISLANGCICCTIRDDLIETTMQTINRPERPEYILLEASGVADPSAIMLTFGADCFRDRIRLDSIICVVDAEQVLAVPELMELKIRQMAFADLNILNKVDLVDRARIDQIRAWLDSRFHRYRLVEASHGNVPLEVLLSVGPSTRHKRTSTCMPSKMAAATAHSVITTTTRTTSRRLSAPGATKARCPCRWRRCGKWCTNCRLTFIEPRALSTRRTCQSDGLCSKWSGSA
jgi:G3E family GTPase